MKKIAKLLFIIYHLIFTSPNGVCRFRPTCSEYTLEAIESYGLLAGAVLSVRSFPKDLFTILYLVVKRQLENEPI